MRSGIRVATHLEVFAQLLVADRATLFKQLLDLFENQRVALDRGRVVRLLQPDTAPDALGLLGEGRPPSFSCSLDG
jgi:hypothetical protein